MGRQRMRRAPKIIPLRERYTRLLRFQITLICLSVQEVQEMLRSGKQINTMCSKLSACVNAFNPATRIVAFKRTRVFFARIL